MTDTQYAGSIASYLAPAPEAFTYDEDGNLTGDGHSTYLYDAENRLIWVQTAPTAVNAGEPLVAFRYYYDYLGRRVIKLDYTWNGTSWVQGAYDVHVYRGWNLIHTKSVSAANVTTLKNYFWGLDLSGTEQGAGGVGGLLVVQEGNNSYLPLYDALGNVHGMITAASVTLGGTSYPAGSLVAEYEYDGFGKTLRKSGPYAAANRIRYSTKYTDAESGLVYYGMRHYSPTLGRFINRDPIGEAGGINLYGFCGNDGVNRWDYLGLDAESDLAEKRARTIGENIRARYQYFNSGNTSNIGNFFISLEGMEPWIKFSEPSHTISYVVDGVTYTVTNDPDSVPSGAKVVFHGTAAQAASNAAAAAADLEYYRAGIIASALETFGASKNADSETIAPNSTAGLIASTDETFLGGIGGIRAPKMVNLSTLGLSVAYWDANAVNGARNLAGSRRFGAAAALYSNGRDVPVGTNAVMIKNLEIAGGAPSIGLFFHGGPGGTGAGLANITNDQWVQLGSLTGVIYILGCDFVSTRNGYQTAQRIADISGATIYATPWLVNYSSEGHVNNGIELGAKGTFYYTPADTVQMYKFTPRNN